ncbi:MAG: c-type cytochrome [Planctomycetes bacterium]|nr:c-type cytochrome [Planctomycetota bacterium]MBT6967202.1 c-type cytochrome [Planctomycetota bacterium]MBT7639727.1 c-type cytochrome [Planctomycetota bacterium]
MIAALFLVASFSGSISGDEQAPPFIGAYASEYRDESSPSISAGLLLLGELGCTACHSTAQSSASWILPRKAPRLDQVAQRIDPHHLLEFILDPATTHPGTVMPSLLADDPDPRQAAVDLVEYLLSRSPPSSHWQPTAPDQVAIEKGERLYHQVGCVSCHEPMRESTNVPLDSNRLTGRVEHWSQPRLTRFLKDPHQIRPSGRMPSLRLQQDEADAIAHYLLRSTKVAAPLDLAIDWGHRKGLDDSSRSRPRNTTITSRLELPDQQRRNDVTTHFSGWLRIEEAGDYHFFLKVDDIGRLRIDEKDVIDLGGKKNYQRKKVMEKDASIHLESGLHPIEVSHFQWVEDSILELEWQGPGIDRGPIDSSLLSNSSEPLPPVPGWDHQSGDAERGQDLYQKLGCAQCHEEGLPATASAIEKLSGPPPDQQHPRYPLSAKQSADLESALNFLVDHPQAPAAAQRVDQTLRTFRCTACHSRGDLGGVAVDRRDFFTGTEPLLGDEGRLPPPLTGVGDKLVQDWLDGVIRSGRTLRSYMHTRMPTFNHPQTRTLAADLIAVDRHLTAVPRMTHSEDAIKSAGQQMAGSGMLQCVLCHDFNQKHSVGMRAMDLVTTTERLNHDWFHRYMLDPESLRPGTQMLAFWPEGRSMIPELLGGDADQQVGALWRYLEDGDQAIFPEGLSRQQQELIVGGEAIVYRGKLWEAGYRGIAVGLPGGIHYAFDAQELRLALLWKGRFLDARAHWSSQGMGRIRPLGRDVMTFAHGPDVVFLTDVNCPWPGDHEEGIRPDDYQFHGYKIGDNKIPTLMYRAGTLDIEETMVAHDVSGDAWLARTVNFVGNADSTEPGVFWMRIRDVPPTEVLDDGTFIYGDGLKIKLSHGATPTTLHKIHNSVQYETWTTLPAERNQTHSITIEYRWGKES